MSLEPLVVTLTVDTSRFDRAMRRAGRATRRFAAMMAGDYITTGVKPFGGAWSRWQIRGER